MSALDAIWTPGLHSLCSQKFGTDDFGNNGFFANPDKLLDAAAKQTAAGREVWFSVHPLTARPEKGRGGAADVASVSMLAADVDWDHPTHKTTGLPTEQEIRDRLKLVTLQPRVIVNSGHGLQLYWPLEGPVTPAEGALLQEQLDKILADHGLDNDRGDLASVLRIPGSMNFKGDPIEVVVEHHNPRKITLETIRRVLGDHQHATSARKSSTSGTTDRGLNEVVAKLMTAGRDQDAEALQVICAHHGGHHPFMKGADVHVTRPDKKSGTSATVGFSTPGVVKMFSANWKPFKKNARYVVNDAGDKLVDADDDLTFSASDDETQLPTTSENTTITPEVVDPDQFFGKNGLLHASLRTAITNEGPLAPGPGRTLWHYANGVWLAGGDDEVRRRSRRLLGQRWRKSHIEGVVADLQASRPFITDDQPTRWINCTNGLLDWRTGQLEPHDPKVPSTYQLAVDWNPDAVCPNVDAWLAQVVDDDVIPLVWEIIGTAIYADQPFHRAVLLLGPGRNGKGTLLRLVSALIGHHHVSAVTLQQLGENRFSAASLFGKVANIAGDLDSRAITRTDLFKMATGGDLIEAEHKYGSAFRFRNRATFLFSANEAPGTADHTDGFFARWVVVPFTRLQLAPGTEDSRIEDRMHTELDGVLVRAVDGLRRAIERGSYAQPASVTAAAAQFRDDSDPVRRFVTESLTVTGRHDCTETRADLYDEYRRWSESNGHRPLGTGKFWGRLSAIDPRIDITRISMGVRRVGGVLLGDHDITETTGAAGAVGAPLTSPPPAYGGKDVTGAPTAPCADPPRCRHCDGPVGADTLCLVGTCPGSRF